MNDNTKASFDVMAAVFKSVQLPESWNKKMTDEEFEKFMSDHNTDMPVENVNFTSYPKEIVIP